MPKIIDEETIGKIRKERGEGVPISRIAKEYGVDRATVKKYLRNQEPKVVKKENGEKAKPEDKPDLPIKKYPDLISDYEVCKEKLSEALEAFEIKEPTAKLIVDKFGSMPSLSHPKELENYLKKFPHVTPEAANSIVYSFFNDKSVRECLSTQLEREAQELKLIPSEFEQIGEQKKFEQEMLFKLLDFTKKKNSMKDYISILKDLSQIQANVRGGQHSTSPIQEIETLDNLIDRRKKATGTSSVGWEMRKNIERMRFEDKRENRKMISNFIEEGIKQLPDLLRAFTRVHAVKRK
jgi:predicted transcriptional regulator